MAEDPDFDCDKYLPGNGCSLPMLPGHYGGEFHGDDAIVIELPQDLVIPDILKPFLDGKIKIHLSLEAAVFEIVYVDTEIGLTCRSNNISLIIINSHAGSSKTQICFPDICHTKLSYIQSHYN